MTMKNCFIKATEAYNTFEAPVPAYYFRRAFTADAKKTVRITVAACGFYELYFNGEKITKGLLSPYISCPDDYIYCDEYEVTTDTGENVIGILLGNGFQNNPGGYIWDFDKASFRSAPMVAVTVAQGDELLLHSGEGFRISPSPIRSDDYRFGVYYDARCEIEGWNRRGFDDATWAPALPTTPPKGELRVVDVAPIVKEQEIAPVAITPANDGGFIYDFGVSNAGVCRLCIKGERGQRIELRHADSLQNGDLNLGQVWFVREMWERDRQIVHRDTYICKGTGTEVYEPTFTYHGFRYVKVNGITEAQATGELLTYLVYHTELHTRGDFICSDGMANTLQEITRRSITSNFHHFPTDCPQREKNGWTADAALSSEAALINFDPERNYREWLRNICKAQNEAGALPGIVPTGGWGFQWGNGPAWDSVLAYLPYYVYLYRGETDMITEAAPTFMAYLRYLRSRCDEKGLLAIGLGDWCHVNSSTPKAPLVLTDTVISMDIARMMAEMLDAIGAREEARFARCEAGKYRAAARAHLIDSETMCALGNCQSSQAMCLHYGVFDPAEEATAFEKLLELIRECDDHIDVGVLGGRVLFHVLTRFGHSDLAYRMITREDFPSYGNWVKRGATTLWEDFQPDGVNSMNHHFWGDISAWFVKCLAGIRLNPHIHNVSELSIAPSFVTALEHVSAYHLTPAGKVAVAWRREGKTILLDAEIPADMSATATLPGGYAFEDGTTQKSVVSGTYRILRIH